MQREKKEKLVITFQTTTAAMAAEALFTDEKGRLIPIPREISGGCGLAWCADPSLENILVSLMAENDIAYQAMKKILMYE